MPGLPAGTFAGRAGPLTASTDTFEIAIKGEGGHAAYPHRTVDPVTMGAQIIGALQTIISPTTDPLESAVLSVTEFHAGSATIVIAETAAVTGTVRTFNPDVRNAVKARMSSIAGGIAVAMGGSAETVIRAGYPSLVNHRPQLE